MSGLSNISPNQFAIPGMEEHAHAGARHLAQGYRFGFGRAKDGYRKPREDAWSMEAHHEDVPAWSDPGSAVSDITWADKKATGAAYPGEIEYVTTSLTKHKGKGLPSAMFKMANTLNMGQDTIPVHSPVRTPEGLGWSNKVGGYGLDAGFPADHGGRTSRRYPNSDEDRYETNNADALDAPHPFKDAESKPEPVRQVPGQENLFSPRLMARLRRPR